MLLALVLAPIALSAQLGDPVEKAVAVHVTQHGLTTLGEAVEALVPPAITIEAMEGEYQCSDESDELLSYALDRTDLLLSVEQVELKPGTDRLDLAVYASLSSSASTLTVSGDCSVLTDLDETCGVQIPTTAVEFHLGMTLAVVDEVVDVVVDDPVISISPINNPLSDCTLESAVGTALGQDDELISGLILSFVEPELLALGPTIEEALEGVFDQMNIETSFALGASTLELALYPTRVEVSEAGLVLGLGADMDVDQPSDCVDWEAGFQDTGADWPVFAETAPGTDLPYDVGLVLSKDMVDQLLFTAWAGGLLCMEVSDLAGAELNAGLLGTFLGEDFQGTFEDEAPASVLVVPTQPPRARFEHDRPYLHADMEQLQLHLASVLDGRDLRVAQVDVDVDLGVDVDLSTEQLALGLDMGEGALGFTEAWSDLLRPGYAQGLSEMVDTLLGSLIPEDLLPTIDLPSLMGVQLGGVWWIPSEDGAWHGAYVLLDVSEVQPIEVPGCDAQAIGCEGETPDFDWEAALGCGEEGGSSGCSSESGGTSCTTVPVMPMRLLVLAMVLLGAGLRRRK